MRFNDITLDGLMKEFAQITKAQSSTTLTYDLPSDLLDDIENIFKNKKLQIKVKHGSSYDFE